MKQLLIISLLTSSLFFSKPINAQANGKYVPKWVSSQGYWVAEGNTNKRNEHIIHFYTNDNQLVYKETVYNKKINLQRRKVKMQLKIVLEKSIADWTATHIATENKDYVKAILH